MRLVYRREPALPLLAWAARMRRHEGVVEVVYGPGVETRADCFFEGARDGSFPAGALDEAPALFGSSGRVVDGEVRFAAPSHMFERLQSIAADCRLCVGFVHLPLPACAALHAPAVRRITAAAEMWPWSLGGGYDRPIPRRFAEDAGVPRQLFGRRKMGGTAPPFGLTPASKRDFLEYRERLARAGHRLPGTPSRMLAEARRRLRRHPQLWWTRHRLLGDRVHPRWRRPELHLFHWGVDHLLERYRSTTQHLT